LFSKWIKINRVKVGNVYWGIKSIHKNVLIFYFQ